jgi:enoyl-CoA hydratase/carnithine racemase
MAYETLNFQKKEHIMTIQIIGSDHDHQLIRLSNELEELSSEIIWDEEVWVIVITGESEKTFSSGIVMPETALGGNEEEAVRLYSIAEPIAKLGKPVIAAMDGDVIGQGLELALACDMRIATERSFFGLPQIKSGFIPWDGGTQRLSRLIGKGRALEMILGGETVGAREAYRTGLVSKIVPPKELIETAMGIAHEMASKGPIALRYTKEAICKGMDMTLEQGLHLEADLYLLLHTTRDRTEGIQAFRERRTPKFEGK